MSGVTTAEHRPTRERRTQGERSATMRRLLLDATVECLVRYGYAGTTTTRVAELAGVSRGAQVHHFSTRNDLVLAAVRHLADRQVHQVLARPERLARSADPVGDALDLLWKAHEGPTFDAAIELWVAARTDAELREATTAFERALTARLGEVAAALFGPRVSAVPDFEARLLTVLEAIRGLRIVAFLHPDAAPRLDERWQRSKALLRTLFDERDVPA
jgi:AcrR family transcriptional regulator